jgi:branched-chain amino acid transport system ATP-binding protein
MLSIGRGLMGRPKLLLLDEPSLGLAPLITSTIFSVIKDLNEGGLPILLVEQNVRAAMQISNRGYVLETGSVVMEGECSELLVDKNVIKAYLGA